MARLFRVASTSIRRRGGAAAADPPEYSSGEIGVVNSKTVEITFSEDMDTDSDYTTGVTIMVGSVSYTGFSGARQSNKSKVHYVLVSGVDGTEAVTWAYSESSGGIKSESDGVALEDVSAQAATNTAFEPGDLSGTIRWWHARPSAANGISGSNDAVIPTWDENGGASANQYGQTTVDKRPLLKTGANGINGQNALWFDGTDDVLTSTIRWDTAFDDANEHTVWLVFEIEAMGASSGGASYGYANVATDSQGWWGMAVSATKLSYWDWSTQLRTVAGVDTPYVSESRHESSPSGTLYFKFNSLGNEVNGAKTGSGGTSGTLLVGANYNASVCFSGKVSEIIYSNRAETSADRAKMQAVLENIYGV